MMAVEIMIARQLCYHAARAKDQGRRCDLEAGDGEAAGGTRRVGCRRQCRANPRRQRLCTRISNQPGVVRRTHSVNLRGCGRDRGPGHSAQAGRHGDEEDDDRDEAAADESARAAAEGGEEPGRAPHPQEAPEQFAEATQRARPPRMTVRPIRHARHVSIHIMSRY